MSPAKLHLPGWAWSVLRGPLPAVALWALLTYSGMLRLDYAPDGVIRDEFIAGELLRNTSAGRQALVGSLLHPPLRPLLLLPLVWAFDTGCPTGVASCLLNGLAGAAAVVFFGRLLGRSGMPFAGAAAALCAFAAAAALCAFAPGQAIATFLILISAASAVKWTVARQLRYLAGFALGAAGAALANIPAAVCALSPFCLWIAAREALAARPWPEKEGTLLLAFTPLFYAVCVWTLCNWLIMGDAGFFLRRIGRSAGIRPVTECPILEIERKIRRESRYVRILACGYDGLSLLARYRSDIVLPALDVEIAEIAEHDPGMRTFLLVNGPYWRFGKDTVHAELPGLWEGRLRGLLFYGQWGSWRVFEVVAAR